MRASASGGFGGYKSLRDFFLSLSSFFRDIAFSKARKEGKEDRRRELDTEFIQSVFTVRHYLTRGGGLSFNTYDA